MRYISRRHCTVKHSGETLVSRKVVRGEEYLQGDEGRVQGEENQVVSPHFLLCLFLNLVPFARLELKLSGLHREKCH